MGLNNVDIHGLDRFLELLDRRKDIEGRERGLLTSTSGLIIQSPVYIFEANRML